VGLSSFDEGGVEPELGSVSEGVVECRRAESLLDFSEVGEQLVTVGGDVEREPESLPQCVCGPRSLGGFDERPVGGSQTGERFQAAGQVGPVAEADLDVDDVVGGGFGSGELTGVAVQCGSPGSCGR